MESNVISLSFTPLRHQLLLSLPAPCSPIAYSTGLQRNICFTQLLHRIVPSAHSGTDTGPGPSACGIKTLAIRFTQPIRGGEIRPGALEYLAQGPSTSSGRVRIWNPGSQVQVHRQANQVSVNYLRTEAPGARCTLATSSIGPQTHTHAHSHAHIPKLLRTHLDLESVPASSTDAHPAGCPGQCPTFWFWPQESFWIWDSCRRSST